MLPQETSLSCATKAFVWLRIIGNVWPPTIQVMMGIDRLIVTMAPLFHFKYLRKRCITFFFKKVSDQSENRGERD
ncbi:unnamed protein product [Strongylus vulgaris]|uniref:Uncharacterized protein n=1 Tax=Strongylus vulgaris TaxID=40348 RepID=A0A3P7JFB5_STRVU|nr:unnamed protein product [Strongylus vulgaris]